MDSDKIWTQRSRTSSGLGIGDDQFIMIIISFFFVITATIQILKGAEITWQFITGTDFLLKATQENHIFVANVGDPAGNNLMVSKPCSGQRGNQQLRPCNNFAVKPFTYSV